MNPLDPGDTDEPLFEARRALVQEWIRDAFDGSQKAFAEATGISKSYVTRMLYPPGKPGRKRIDTTIANKIEARLDRPGQLLDPFGNERSRENVTGGLPSDTPRDGVLIDDDQGKKTVLPVLSWERMDLMSANNQELIAEGHPTYEVPKGARGPNAKIVRMPDGSLPDVPKGAFVEFDPGMPELELKRPGRIVLLRSGSGAISIRRFDALMVEQQNLSILAGARRWYVEEE